MLSLIYLFEMSRWKEEAIKGNISNRGLVKLTKAGVRKPVLRYFAGINTGTENIRKKAGAVHINRPDEYIKNPTKYNVLTGYAAGPIEGNRTNRRNTTSEPTDKRYRDQTGIVNRHEAYEARAVSKDFPEARTTKRLINIDLWPKPQHFFSHYNKKVLQNEFRDVKILKSLYPHLKNESTLKALESARESTGETKVITGIEPKRPESFLEWKDRQKKRDEKFKNYKSILN